MMNTHMPFERYDAPSDFPIEPGEGALRRAVAELTAARAVLQRQLDAALAEEVRARVALRPPHYPHGPAGALRHRIHELTCVIEWMDYRADMRGAL